MARGLLELKHPHAVAEVRHYVGFDPGQRQWQPHLKDWPAPSLATVAGTWLEGALAAGPAALGEDAVMGAGPPPGMEIKQSDPSPYALLYVGECRTLRPLLPDRTVFDDPDYRAELDRRFQLRDGRTFDPDAYIRDIRSLFGRC
jgi:hypothetical protein